MPTYRDTHSGHMQARALRGSFARVVRIIVLVVLALLIAVLGLFSWNRWFRFDDASDLQGVWRTTEGSAVLAFDGSRMLVDGQVAYDYTVDVASKIITYTFAGAQGTSAYRFSDDRATLVLQDNAATDWLMAFHLKEDDVLAGGQVPAGTTRLKRTSEDAAEAFRVFDKKPADAEEPASGSEGSLSEGLQSSTGSADASVYQDAASDQQYAYDGQQDGSWSTDYAQGYAYAPGVEENAWPSTTYSDGTYGYGSGSEATGQGW